MAGFESFRRARERAERIDKKIDAQIDKGLLDKIIQRIQVRIYDLFGCDYEPMIGDPIEQN